jgi:hypothetical protein
MMEVMGINAAFSSLPDRGILGKVIGFWCRMIFWLQTTSQFAKIFAVLLYKFSKLMTFQQFRVVEI